MSRIGELVEGTCRDATFIACPFFLEVGGRMSLVWFGYHVHHGIGHADGIHTCPVDDLSAGSVTSYDADVQAPCDFDKPFVKLVVSPEERDRKLEEMVEGGVFPPWRSLLRGAEQPYLRPLYQAVCDHLGGIGKADATISDEATDEPPEKPSE